MYHFDGDQAAFARRIDLSEEYRRFFAKASEVSPEEVTVAESTVERQMSSEEKERMVFAQARNAGASRKFWTSHKQSFREILNNTIRMTNTKALPDAILFWQYLQTVKQANTRKNIALGLFVAVTTPMLFSLLSRKIRIRKQMAEACREQAEQLD